MGVSCMTRVNHTDTILVGTNSNLFVVDFKYDSKHPGASHFSTTHKFPAIHSWLITSIAYYFDERASKLETYSVSRKDQYVTKIVLSNFKGSISSS